jgi:uncharacterized membrane protein
LELALPPLLLEWLGTLLRVVHVLAGILWIGDSFLFMWMDASLEQPRRQREGAVVGELWMVHSGGFYEVVKRRSLAPAEMPPNLYWFKWQSYSTWISGAFLLAVVYWLGGGAMLVDSGARLSRGAAVLVSAGTLVAGWLVYDAACRLLRRRPALLATLLSLAFAAAVFGLTRVFGARAAWLESGALLGTIMAANVWRVIIPGQAKMLAQTRAGVPVDTAPGVLAKERSTHNHYLTFPVLFLMLSQHFPAGYGHPLGWLVLLLVCGVGVALKYVMNARARSDWRAVVAGAAALVAAIVLTARPAPGATSGGGPALAIHVPDEQAFAIVERRCTTCHAEHPSNPAFPQAPSGVMLDRPDRLRALAPRVRVRAVETKTMPLGNLTGMTDAERDTLGAWLARQR